jgi:transposase InsO family protein
MIEVQLRDRVEMSQRERDVLKVMQVVLDGKRTQAEAARLLKRSVRQVRRIQRKLEADGDGALVHGLRGRPSNHQHESSLRRRVVNAYRSRYSDFGPTLACEKLAAEQLHVGVETLRRWLLAEGLWERRRRRDPHRSRRPRRSCFGELVQMDASIHDWLEGRGDELVLITMIDDATSRLAAKFYRCGTVEAHMDLLETWLRKYGRPHALYTDRHSIFEAHEKGQPLADPEAKTQFGRALEELDIALIRAYSPQANGKIERWHKTLKGDCIRTQVPLSLDDARRIVADYVAHYNGVRLHSAIGYVTPQDKLAGQDREIHAARDRKLDDARERRKTQRQAQRDRQCQPPVTPRPAIDFAAVKAAVTLAAVLQLLGCQLHGRGAQQRGPCPLHGSTSDTSRCFSAHLDQNTFHCFKCGRHGNALDLWAAAQQLTPYDAAIDLCQRLAIPLPTLPVVPRNREEEPVAPSPNRATMPTASTGGVFQSLTRRCDSSSSR